MPDNRHLETAKQMKWLKVAGSLVFLLGSPPQGASVGIPEGCGHVLEICSGSGLTPWPSFHYFCPGYLCSLNQFPPDTYKSCQHK